MGWTLVNICDLCDSVSVTYSKGADMVTLVNTSDVLDGKFLNINKVPNKNLKGQFKKTFQKGDILYSEIRPINKHFAYVDFDATDHIASTKLMVLRAKPNVNSLFLYHILKNISTLIQLQALAEARSGTFPQITYSEMANVHVFLPDRATQDRIVAILSSIDDKIELNRRINANLEQQAQALYKSWFVDNKKDDWEEKRLDDIISIYDSQRKPLSGQQREKMEKLYPYYGAASLMDYVDNYLFDGIYLLLGEDGTVSDSEGFPMLQYVWGKFWVNNHAHILQGKNGFTTESLYILLKQTNVSSIVTGAVQPKISQANLKSVPITMPPINLLNQYNNIIKPIFNQIRINHNQIQQLSTLRDTLLPKLMSGEIVV